MQKWFWLYNQCFIVFCFIGKQQKPLISKGGMVCTKFCLSYFVWCWAMWLTNMPALFAVTAVHYAERIVTSVTENVGA